MVFIHRIPFLEDNLLRRRADLRGHELLEVPDRVVGFAFDADFLAESVVAGGGGKLVKGDRRVGGGGGVPDDFDHGVWGKFGCASLLNGPGR